MARSRDSFVASHSRSVEEGERIVDAYFRRLSKEVSAAILEVVGEGNALEPQHLPAIMRRVDIALERIYPGLPGAGSPLEDEIVANANRSRIRSVKAAMAPIAPAIRKDPQLLAAIEGRNG